MTETTEAEIRDLIPRRKSDSSKRDYGSVLAIAGSEYYRGAAVLSSAAALRVGAGYVTLACPRSVAVSVAAVLPDAVLLPLRTKHGCLRGMEYPKVAAAARRAGVIVLGCGLSSPSGGTHSLRRFFKRVMGVLSGLSVPVVLDADGLNLLAELQPLALPASLVMTPHEAELARLLKTEVAAVRADREGNAALAAKRFGAVVVLKGHRTVVADPASGAVWENPTGNSALAKAGSGDVLSGMIAGMLAQGLTPADAARVAVYLHGRAGELASAETTEYGLLASELGRYIPRAIAGVISGK